MNTIAYCRVSTLNQRESETITIQTGALQKYAQDNGYNLIQIFKDDGVSGSKELQNRPGLAAMFNFLERRQNIDAVLIFKLDRLARDLYVQEFIIRELQKLDIQLISIKEPDIVNTGDPMRKAFRQFMGIMAELERAFIALRLTEGRYKKARSGGFAGGQVSLGYKTTRKQLKVNLNEAEAVQLIFSLHGQGKSLHEISRTLTLHKIPTKRGGQWHPSTVRKILNNQLYAGIYNYNGIKSQKKELQLI